MSMSRRDRRDWRTFRVVLVVTSIISAAFGYFNRDPGETAWRSVPEAIAVAFAIATPIMMFELRADRVDRLKRLRRLPLTLYFAIKLVFYMVVIVSALLLMRFVFSPDLDHLGRFDASFRRSLVFAIGMSFLVNLIFEIGALIGFGTLKNLLTGRYVQPRREERAFLLIDMKDSTGMAERLGSVRFHELLNDFFRDVSDAAFECEAEIHKYVGDEAILTWQAGNALTEGDCLRCPFVVEDFIERHRALYLQRYGALPSFRAAAHYGEIVAGEIGDVRREIAYIGDTLNVAARLLDAAKTLGREILVSQDLLQRAALPDGIKAENLPTLTVRGRAAPLAIAALERIRQVSVAAS